MQKGKVTCPMSTSVDVGIKNPPSLLSSSGGGVAVWDPLRAFHHSFLHVSSGSVHRMCCNVLFILSLLWDWWKKERLCAPPPLHGLEVFLLLLQNNYIEY